MNEQQTALLESLLARTNDGKVDWQKTADDDTFQAVLGGHIIAIARRSPTPDFSFVLTIFNSNGDEIESISTVRVDLGLAEFDDAEKRMKNMLAELFELARRRAHGAEEAIDAILQELNS